MGQKKLQRFEDIKSFPNVLQYPENMQGRWQAFFKNNNTITLELACGKAEYTVEMAQMHPQKNFIGVDIKGNRIWVGAKKCIEKNIVNTAFLRTQIDKINNYFDEAEVDEIWITFPDPHLRMSKAKKRLTHPKFLRLYKQFLKQGGCIHLKTDSPDLYKFTKTIIQLYNLITVADIDDVYKNENISAELKIKTYYETLDIAGSSSIFYLCFRLPAAITEDDTALKVLLKKEEIKEIYE